MPLSYNYDKHDRRDILRHAKALEGYAVGDVYELELHGKQRDKILEYYAEKCIQGWTDVDGTAHRGDKGRIGFLVQEVYFDEPFLYMIMDMESKTPLFMGVMDNPVE